MLVNVSAPANKARFALALKEKAGCGKNNSSQRMCEHDNGHQDWWWCVLKRMYAAVVTVVMLQTPASLIGIGRFSEEFLTSARQR